MLSLYPAIAPFKHYYLKVADNTAAGEEPVVEHQLYIEHCGNPSGIPVVFLHGGPGSGCRPAHRCYFDPAVYHIILFDQRGCGRSRPYGALAQNTTAHIIKDMELIRQHIGINKWLLFGGSWGATLALCYAHQFAKHVSGLILRGVFLARKQDIDWVYSNNGAAKIFPDAWSQLVADLPCLQQAQPLAEIYQQLTSDDVKLSNAIFNKLQYWEASLIYWQDLVSLEESSLEEPSLEKTSLAQANGKQIATTAQDKTPAIIQLYYSMHECFIATTPLLECIDTIRHIPTTIIHGRHDMVCPLEQAWQLKQHWPEAKLSIIEMAGHVANEPKIIDALVKATNEFSVR